MTRLETEQSRPIPRGALIGLGLVMIIVAGALAGVFAFKLQPTYHPPGTFVCPTGDACVTIVDGASSPYTGYSGTATRLYGYSPGNITVVIGTNNTVVWSNDDVIFHTVTSNTLAFDSGCISSTTVKCSPASATTYQYTFTTPGVYVYHCSYHPWMEGVVVVKAASAA